MIGERVKVARASAGLSMQALAEKVGVSANMIKKYEHNQSMPSSPVLIKLAKALGVRSEYFFRPAHVKLLNVEYRKKARLTQKSLNRITGDVTDQVERWMELKNLWPEFPIPAFTGVDGLPEKIETMDQLEDAAEAVRASWQLGLNPLPEIVDLLEAHGILVIVTDIEVENGFDGLQATVDDQPVVVISRHWCGDRQRFTLAHELGHLMLRNQLASGIDEERACNRFASALLLPAESIRKHLGSKRHHLEPRELYLLKHEFGISMAACIHRAGDLGIISPAVKTQLQMMFSKNGWRKEEPGDQYPQEHTALFEQLVYRGLGENIIGESKAAELLQIPLHKLHHQRLLETADAVAGK